MSRNFREMLEAKWAEGKFVCVGLDSKFSRIPKSAHRKSNECDVSIFHTLRDFNFAIVEVTKDLVCAYKPNLAFYQEHGSEGMAALQRTIMHINSVAPGVPVILDSKDGDIGNTNDGYVLMAFNFFCADAVTVSPYLGGEALQPFLDQKDKGIIVLCRTSNKGAGEFQDIPIHTVVMDDPGRTKIMPLYQVVAAHVANEWNKNVNCALVVGATHPHELHEVRELVGYMPILIPAIGAQGGDLEKAVLAGKDSRGRGMIINSSRGIIFASDGEDFAEAARRETFKLHKGITACLKGERV